MAITVDGYGAIHKGNAKEIYLAYNRGEIELNKAQETKCKSFLSPEELDEIAYDEQVQSKEGAEKINTKNEDGEVVEDNGNGTEIGATASAGIGSIGTICSALMASGNLSKVNGFVALICVAATLIGSAAALAMSYMFDNQLGDRNAKKDQAPTDNQTMDGYSEGLAGSMEMMNEDAELYKEQSAQLTIVKNEQTSRGAELQMEYDTAMAMGDKAGAEKAKAEMQKLGEADNSELEEGLKETGEGLEEYRAMNAESVAVAESGQTVSTFLQEGKPKAIMANVSGYMCLAASIFGAVITAACAIPKLWTIIGPLDAAPAGISSVLWGAVTATMALSSRNYLDKGKQEKECGNAGDDMQTHVSQLTDMVDQQTQYTDDTEATYAETDEASAESQEEAGKQAAGATAENKDNLNNKPKEEKEPTGATA